MTQKNLLANVLIKKNVISPIMIKHLMEHCERVEKTDLSVFDAEKSNATGKREWKVDKNVRDTQHIDLGDKFPVLHQIMWNSVHEIINPFYECQVKDSELPQILSYGVGGHYGAHIDAEALWHTPTGELIWKKSVDRDLSMILYLNDEFEGGDLIMPDLGIRIRPEPGTLVCFPSDHNYKHGVEPVTKGKRYSIVCWATVLGRESLEEQNERLSKKYGVVINN